MRLLASAVEAIGMTPLVELGRISRGRELLDGECRGETVVTVICDSGLKYLSTDLWEDPDI